MGRVSISSSEAPAKWSELSPQVSLGPLAHHVNSSELNLRWFYCYVSYCQKMGKKICFSPNHGAPKTGGCVLVSGPCNTVPSWSRQKPVCQRCTKWCLTSFAVFLLSIPYDVAVPHLMGVLPNVWYVDHALFQKSDTFWILKLHLPQRVSDAGFTDVHK